MSLWPLLSLLPIPWIGPVLIPIIFPVLVSSVVTLVFGFLNFIFCIICLSRRSNPTPHWRGLLAIGIIGIIPGYGIGILVIIAAVQAKQAGKWHRDQASRVTRPTQRAVPRYRRIYRPERLERFQGFDQQIVKSLQAAQKSFKAKRWRTVVKHSWKGTEALLQKLYEINFNELPEALPIREVIRRLTPRLPRGRQTAAAIEEVHRIRSRIKPGSPPVKQEDAERVLAAAHQLCFWFNIRLDADTKTVTVQPVTPKDEKPPKGLCGVCNLQLRVDQRTLTTPCCSSICHYACLSEWVKVKQVCPLCRKRLQFRRGEILIRD